MMYYIQLKGNVVRFLDKLDKNTRIQIDKAITELKYDPQTKGKFIGSLYSGIVFYEKRIKAGGGIRIYFSVMPEMVTINKIEYEGLVPVHKIGTKKTQKKDIRNLKRKS